PNRQPAQARLRLPDAADVLDGDRGLPLRPHPAHEVAKLLPELREDVLEAPLERPLLILLFRLGHQMDGARGGCALPPRSKTRSSTRTGTLARTARAIASEGRESSWSSLPPAVRYTVA